MTLGADKNPAEKSKLALRRSSGIDLPYNSAIDALRAYHTVHGDLVIPRRYIVPHDNDTFPKEWHGVDLSSTVYNMNWWQKNVKSKPSRVEELNKLGFVWERLQPEWNLVLEALISYATLHGDVLVPHKFVVPHGESRWPKATWKIPLGNCVYRIRSRNDFLRNDVTAASRREQLDGLGFIWDVHEHRFRIFYKILRHYAKLEGCGPFSNGRTKSLSVPSMFVVPSDARWPKELWSYPLGAKCSAVRQKELYVKGKAKRKQVLESLGFHWSGNSDLGWLQVVHAAAIFSRMNNRHLAVPYHFVVPAPPSRDDGSILVTGDDWPWPENLWGLPLGQRLKDVRTKGAYLSGEIGMKRRHQLNALGFVWKPSRGRPRKLSAD
jgi:Helicase associated domain